MAGQDDKDKTKPVSGSGAPRKLDRRDVLKGLSTVPALGLFGYAWEKQREYQQTKLEEIAATPAALSDTPPTQKGPQITFVRSY